MLRAPIGLQGLAYRAADGTEVRGLDLEVEAGDLVALVGPGADEALAVLVALRTAEDGTATISGLPFGDHPRPARVVGVVTAHGDLPAAHRVRTHLRVCALVAGVPRSAVGPAAERAGLDPASLAERPAALSALERRRAAVAGALVGTPPALVLVAPFDRLRESADIQALGTLLRREAADGRAVLFSCADPRIGAAVAPRTCAPAAVEVAA